MDEFVAIVRKEAKLQGITVVDLAEKADVSREYMYQVFRRECVPSVEWLEKVARVLGMTLILQKSRR